MNPRTHYGNTHLSLVMEYADGGDLLHKINTHKKNSSYPSEREIWQIFIQIVRGLKALHDLDILHRDLKCANIFLFNDGVVKLGDMNVSKVAKRGLVYTQTGTPYYASPEVWRDLPYDLKSDIWSLGCVMYETITLNPPFRAQDMQGLYKKVIRGVYPPLPSQYSPDLNNLIRTLLQVNPAMRPTCDKLLDMPLVQRNTVQNQDSIEGESNLLGTIKIPRQITNLASQLPAPSYGRTSRNRSVPSTISNSLVSPSSLTDASRNVIKNNLASIPKNKSDEILSYKPPESSALPPIYRNLPYQESDYKLPEIYRRVGGVRGPSVISYNSNSQGHNSLSDRIEAIRLKYERAPNSLSPIKVKNPSQYSRPTRPSWWG